MVKTIPLLLLLAAAASQVDLSLAQTSFSSAGEFNISSCPINFYGHSYTMLEVFLDTSTAGFCFIDDNGTTGDCLSFERYDTNTSLKLSIQNYSLPPPESLPDVVENSTCQIFIEQNRNDSTILMEYYLLRYGFQTVWAFSPDSNFSSQFFRFNVTVQESVVLAVESNITFYDLSGCRISEPPYGVTYGHEATIAGTCFNRTCNAVTGQMEGYKHKCGNGDLCNNTCITVCSVTGSSVADFSGNLHMIPDRCVYSLLKPQGNSSFEILAGFRERRRLDVPFLDYLILQSNLGTIYLEQGGRIWVNGTTVYLNSMSQYVFYEVEVTMDQHAVTAKLLLDDITVTFDGTTAHLSGQGLAAQYDGLCGNPVDPSHVTNLTALNTSSENAAGCGIQQVDVDDPSINCGAALQHCLLMNGSAFDACHNVINNAPYLTACYSFLCTYPAVDGLPCQFLESYVDACSLANVSLGDWRSTTNCLVAPSSCLTQYCSTHEFCGEGSTGAECFCRADFASKYKSNDTFGEQAVCTQDSATLSLAACLLTDANIDYSLLSLNDPNCTGHLDPETHILEFSFNSTNSCGSEVTTNNSQAIFKNTISVSSDNAIISRQRQVFITFSCLYTATQPQGPSFRIREGSVVQHIESELLNYTLFLNTYDDSALTNMIAPNTEVLLDQKIWVKLRAEGLDWNLLTLVTDSCWATNEPTSTAPQQYSLISNGCPNPSDGTVEIQGNGMGLSNVFSFNMFEFSGRSHDVYLHCMLELCPKPGHSCVPSCGWTPAAVKRRRRSSLFRSRRALISLVWSN